MTLRRQPGDGRVLVVAAGARRRGPAIGIFVLLVAVGCSSAEGPGATARLPSEAGGVPAATVSAVGGPAPPAALRSSPPPGGPASPPVGAPPGFRCPPGLPHPVSSRPDGFPEYTPAQEQWGTVPAAGPGGWSRGAVGLGAAVFVWGHGRYVVSGERHGGTGGEGYVETSRDGRTWQQVLTVVPPQFGAARLDQVVVTGAGFAAWGEQGDDRSGNPQRVEFTADPTGTAWTRRSDVGSGPPEGSVVGFHGGYAGLQRSRDSRPRWWLRTSPDAVHWSQHLVPDLTGQEIADLFATARGTLVVGTKVEQGRKVSRGWATSPDGLHWALRPLGPAFNGLAEGDADLSVAGQDSRGLIALSTVKDTWHRSCPALWRSRDEGRTWTRQPLDGSAFAGAELRGLTVTPAGVLVAAGSSPEYPTRPAAWTSHDGGNHWHRVTPVDPFFNGPYSTHAIRAQILGRMVVLSAEYAFNKPLIDPLLHDLDSLS